MWEDFSASFSKIGQKSLPKNVFVGFKEGTQRERIKWGHFGGGTVGCQKGG